MFIPIRVVYLENHKYFSCNLWPIFQIFQYRKNEWWPNLWLINSHKNVYWKLIVFGLSRNALWSMPWPVNKSWNTAWLLHYQLLCLFRCQPLYSNSKTQSGIPPDGAGGSSPPAFALRNVNDNQLEMQPSKNVMGIICSNFIRKDSRPDIRHTRPHPHPHTHLNDNQNLKWCVWVGGSRKEMKGSAGPAKWNA